MNRMQDVNRLIQGVYAVSPREILEETEKVFDEMLEGLSRHRTNAEYESDPERKESDKLYASLETVRALAFKHAVEIVELKRKEFHRTVDILKHEAGVKPAVSFKLSVSTRNSVHVHCSLYGNTSGLEYTHALAGDLILRCEEFDELVKRTGAIVEERN